MGYKIENGSDHLTLEETVVNMKVLLVMIMIMIIIIIKDEEEEEDEKYVNKKYRNKNNIPDQNFILQSKIFSIIE